jgi:hypothetical protein
MATEPAPKIRTVAPNVSSGTAAVIDRALMFKRNDRWANAAAMRAAVDKAIDELGGETITIDSGMIVAPERVEPRHKTQVPEPSPTPPPAKKPSVPSRESKPKIPMKRSWSSVVVWLLVLAGVGVGGKLAYDKYGKTMLESAMDGGLVSFDVPLDAGPTDASVPDARVAPTSTPTPTTTHSAPKRHDAGTRPHH